MRNILALVLVVALLAGCVGGGETTSTTPEEAPASAPAPSGPAMDGAPDTPVGGGLDMADMAYLELAALGQPVECDITTTTQGQTMVMKLRILGDSTYTEMDVPEMGKIISIQKRTASGLKSYTDMSGPMGAMYAMYTEGMNCNWLEADVEGSDASTEGVTQGTYAPSDLESIPSTHMDCRMGTFGEEAFATTGNTCTAQDIEDAMMAKLAADGFTVS